jgi:hypothetical protein
MQTFVAMLAWGTSPGYPGPIVAWILCSILVIALILGIVNQKKLEEMDKEAKRKKDPPKPRGKPWKCEKCGETSEPQFDSCWKCGAERKNEKTP